MKKTPSPGKFQRSEYIGPKSAEFVEGSDSIVTLSNSEGQHSSLRLKGRKIKKKKKQIKTKRKRLQPAQSGSVVICSSLNLAYTSSRVEYLPFFSTKVET